MIVRNDIDDQELAVAIAAGRARDADVDELEARRRSRAAIRRWSTRRIPAGLNAENDVPILMSRHAEYWLSSSSGLVRSVDPNGLGSRPFHAVDAGDLGVDSRELLGFTLPGLWNLSRRLLPRSAAPGPVVAINVVELVRDTLAQDDTIEERSLRESIRLVVAAVALHEAGHVVDQELAGEDFEDDQSRTFESLPLDDVRRVFRRHAASKPDAARRTATHGPTWLRAAAHLFARASKIPNGDWLLDWHSWEARSLVGPCGDDIFDALSIEITGSPDEPILDILRRPAPTSFDRLLASRGAA